MTYLKTYLPTLKTLVVNLKRDAKDLSRVLQWLEVRGKLESKTLYYQILSLYPPPPAPQCVAIEEHIETNCPRENLSYTL